MIENSEDFIDNLNPNRISDKKIFFLIWTSPRKVFQFINSYKYEKHMNGLLILAGISRSFDRALSKNMGDTLSIWALIAICIITGALFGWISYYIYAALLSWTGKWIDGTGNTDSILRVMSYALIPSIASLLLLVPQMAIYGTEMFKSEGDLSSGGILANIITYSSIILQFILGIWSLILCVIAVSEVQKLSIGKSILNLVLAAMVIIVPILIIVLFLYLIG